MHCSEHSVLTWTCEFCHRFPKMSDTYFFQNQKLQVYGMAGFNEDTN